MSSPDRLRRQHRGFTLVETTVALVLVAMAATTLVMAFGAASRFGVLTRRQANAVALARSQAAILSTLPYGDLKLVDSNTGNSATFADPAGLFAQSTLPTGADAPDWPLAGAVQTINLYGESYELYVNVVPDVVNGSEQGKDFAVIIRYHVGTTWARAVVLGYRYNPASNNSMWMPI